MIIPREAKTITALVFALVAAVDRLRKFMIALNDSKLQTDALWAEDHPEDVILFEHHFLYESFLTGVVLN